MSSGDRPDADAAEVGLGSGGVARGGGEGAATAALAPAGPLDDATSGVIASKPCDGAGIGVALALSGELTMKQIGAELGIAAETARKHHQAAMRELAAALSEHRESPAEDDEWKIRPGTERGAESEDQYS